MAGVKISNLPPLPSAAFGDLLPEVQPAAGGTTYKATLQQIYDLFNITGGSVNAGTINQLAWYATTGNAVSGLPTGNNGTLVTSAGGVPSISSTLPTAVQANITQLGAQSQALNMNTHLINNVVDPVSNQDAATKKYVDDTSQGRQLKDPVEAATTATFSATYANGAAGVGATLTGTVMAAFAPDGVTLALGDRVLFKDQASSFQNGIYTTTVLGTGAVLPVFTRSTDMDTPSQFQFATTLVLNGTVNTGRTYTETLAVVTIGTDPVVFVQTGDATGITSISAADATVTLTPNPIVSTGTIGVNTATFIRAVKVQVINATGTYTPSAGLLYAVVEGCGPGGGSGGAAGGVGTGGASAGGGGGGTFKKTFTVAQVGASAACVIGTGGAAGAAGNNAGGAGSGATTFTPAGTGGVLTGNAGSGGAGSPASATASVSGNGGLGGTATGGDQNIVGCDGQPGFTLGFTIGGIAGFGGNPYLGTPNVNNTSGNAAPVQGVLGEGAAGAGSYAGANVAGAIGGDGFIVVTEYCSIP